MKITSHDLLTKPLKALPPYSGSKDAIQMDLAPGGKVYTLWCKNADCEADHKRCRYERCDCTCHDSQKALPPVRQPGTIERPLIPIPWIALACRNTMHIVCNTDGCECDCHDEDMDHFFNPAFKHEMER